MNDFKPKEFNQPDRLPVEGEAVLRDAHDEAVLQTRQEPNLTLTWQMVRTPAGLVDQLEWRQTTESVTHGPRVERR